MYGIIKSKENSRFKHVKSLQAKKYRDLSNRYLIEGLKIVKEALTYNAEFHMLLFSTEQSDNKEISGILTLAEADNIPIYQIDNKIFKDLSETKSPQGIIGVVEKLNFRIGDILKREILKMIILDGVSDPGNLGTIIRTADACNYDLVLLSKGCVDLYNSKTLRATMGSHFHLPLIINIGIKETIESLQNNNIKVYGADVHIGENISDIKFDHRFAIVIGNESLGLSEDSKKVIKRLIKIPMPGQAESLNASVAASIIMYESIRNQDDVKKYEL